MSTAPTFADHQEECRALLLRMQNHVDTNTFPSAKDQKEFENFCEGVQVGIVEIMEANSERDVRNILAGTMPDGVDKRIDEDGNEYTAAAVLPVETLIYFMVNIIKQAGEMAEKAPEAT